MRGRVIAVFFCLCALMVSFSPAQEVSTSSVEVGGAGVNPDEAIVVGPFLFSPALELNWQYNDNIFFTPDNEVADQIYMARARFLFELPINQSVLYFSYTPQYRQYKTYDLRDRWEHFFAAGGNFQFSSGFTLGLTYNYVAGNLSIREVDPGGELVEGFQNFTKNLLAVELGYWFGPRDAISGEVSWTDVRYDDTEQFFPYTRLFAGIGWQHLMSSNMVMELQFGHIDFDAENAGSTNNTFRDSSSNQVTVGLNGQLSPVVSTELVVGYRETSYEVLPGEPPTEDFKGIIANGFINWEMAHGSIISLDLLRSDFPSYFDANAYYLATGGGLTYALDRGDFFWNLRGRYQVNDYKLPDRATGILRTDDLLTAGAGVGYHITPIFTLFGNYQYQDRASTIYEYSYTANIFTLGLVIGY